MNEHNTASRWLRQFGGRIFAAALAAALSAALPLQAAETTADAVAKAEAVKKPPAKARTKAKVSKPKAEAPGATAQTGSMPPADAIEFAPQVSVIAGKSAVLKLPEPAARISVGNPAVADVILLNPREIYLLGKTIGATNVILWSKAGRSTVVDVTVGMDTAALQSKLQLLLPDEKNIKVTSAADSLVLSGTVADAVRVDKAMALAEAYSGKKVVNLLNAGSPQQVMLEVKVAEVSKSLIDKLGAGLALNSNAGVGGNWTYSLLAGFLTGSPAVIGAVQGAQRSVLLDAQKQDGLVKILAEPTIMAMSGQEGAFLAGGKIFIPVPQAGAGGVTTITLEEKEFGVGLKFTPFVLEGGLINLKVAPEVSELSTTGTTISAVGLGNSVLPSITTRRASTTVQLHDGQSFAIGGLIKNNVNETMKAFPVLGEIPILGALFRSSEFQHDRTELVFVVTPRLVKPLPPNYALPTDSFVEPSRGEFFLGGKLEGEPKNKNETPSAEAPKAAAETKAPAQTPDAGGFQMK